MKKLFVANWKMFMGPQDSHNYFQTISLLETLATKNTIIICPSFISLPLANESLKNSSIKLAAQDCSAFNIGAYTGQISAQSLAEIGCSYSIIGHYERRLYCNETDEAIAEKAKRLIENNIAPILCIGETIPDCIETTTYAVLSKQLNPILEIIKQYNNHNLLIAYEPAWAIGTGVPPTQEYLSSVFAWLHAYVTKQLPSCSSSFIYGGSVTAENSNILKNIPYLNGYIIGKASTDIHALKQIIDSSQ